jgi:hypothetical protein
MLFPLFSTSATASALYDSEKERRGFRDILLSFGDLRRDSVSTKPGEVQSLVGLYSLVATCESRELNRDRSATPG